jgi:M6 family metalloprotease-like protein
MMMNLRLTGFHFFLFAFLALPFFLKGQQFSETIQPHSWLGQVHTPKGDLHMLLIFVRFGDKDLMPNAKIWPNESAEGILPDMAAGNVNQLFHNDPGLIGSLPEQNISDFYYAMSGGTFRITADVFPVQVPVQLVPTKGGNFFSRQRDMNNEAIKWIAENYPDFDWSRYDRRKNGSNYTDDNQAFRPDSILDYVLFLYRDPGSTGMGASGSISIPNSPYSIRDGQTGIKAYSDAEHNWEYFKHEFAHNLFGCPHYMGANGADGTKYYVSKGWGLMAAWHSPFFTANAWESWWLGWMDTQTISRNGTYSLKDYVTERDAIRIRIPGTQDYLWLENHQKISPWDDKIFFMDPAKGHPQSAKGLYAYVVSEAGADRNQPKLSPFDVHHANMIKMLNGEGNFDYRPTGDSIQTEYFPSIVWEKAASNPIAGQNDLQMIRFDVNGDGKIPVNVSHGNKDGGAGEHYEIWGERINGKNEVSYNCTGDEKDGFQIGDEISLSGIIPALNYPEFHRDQENLDPFVLNGIQIRIISETDGSFNLEIRFDDWEIRSDKRWCGNLRLPGTDFDDPDKYLTIGEGINLQLDLGGTPDRIGINPETGTLTNPTLLSVEANRGISLSPGSRLTVENFSSLELNGNAQIVIESGAVLEVRSGGKLWLKDRSRIIVRRGGKLIVQRDGKLHKMNDAEIGVESGGKLKIKS